MKESRTEDGGCKESEKDETTDCSIADNIFLVWGKEEIWSNMLQTNLLDTYLGTWPLQHLSALQRLDTSFEGRNELMQI